MTDLSSEIGSPVPVNYAEGRVSVAGRELRYVEAGEGPPLVWLHGGFGLHPSAGTDLLAQAFHLIAFELPGFGASSADASPQSFDEIADVVAGAIRTFGLKDFILHGTSFGGATALHLALDHPGGVSRVILESPAAFRPKGWTPPDMETLRRGLFRHPERARRATIDPAVQGRQRELVNRLSVSLDQDALAARLRTLPIPLVVMFGEFDTLTPPTLADRYCDSAPDGRSIVIADAAHVISTDQPAAYATTVRQFAAA